MHVLGVAAGPERWMNGDLMEINISQDLYRGLLPLLAVWGGHFELKIIKVSRLRKFGNPK